MFFNAKISVVIGDKALQTVVSVTTENESSHVGATCDLVVPLNCRIKYQDGKDNYLTDYARNLFKNGDAITVKAQYEGMEWLTVFKGFVYDFIEGNPLTIKCLDYIYFFNLGIFGNSRVVYKKSAKAKKVITGTGASYPKITLRTLLQNLIDYVNDTIDESLDDAEHVSLVTPVFDMTLVNISFVSMSPAAILEWLKKELGLNVSLSGPKLYCNIASNTLGLVKYDTTRNVLRSGLQRRLATFQRFKLKAWFLREDGTRDSFQVGDDSGTLKEVFFYRVARDENLYRKMADEALLKFKQHKYSGTIETLLYPAPELFWKVEYKDYRYPERSGNYVVMGMTVTLDENGYHRTIKLAFLSDLL